MTPLLQLLLACGPRSPDGGDSVAAADDSDVVDEDDDGYSPPEDCDDHDARVHPGAPEGNGLGNGNGVDNDCDGLTDEGTLDYDDDGDGYTEEESDCDDADATVNPGAVELDNEVDENCDGSLVDEVLSLSSGPSIAEADPDLHFGVSVFWTADVTGDGGPDLLVGADDATEFQEAEGRVFVLASPIAGAVAAAGAAHAVITSDQNGDFSGRALGSPGDVNGDGVGDVAFTSAVSIVKKGGGPQHPGRVFLFLGPVTGALEPTDAEAMYYETEPWALFGAAVTWLPGLSGNPQWVVGACGLSDSKLPGRAYVFDGIAASDAVSAQDTAVATILGEGPPWDGAGLALDSLDFDGDGVSDLLAGASENALAGKESGSVYVALGPFSGERAFGDGLIWRGEAPGDHAGGAIAGVGDVDDDGYDDFAVGAHGYGDLSDRAGRAYVVRGGGDAEPGERSLADAWLRIDAEATHAFGTALSPSGDIDGEGSTDLSVLADGAPSKVYIFLGPLVEGTVSAADANRIVVPDDYAAGSDTSLTGGVDQDADGFDDLAIGRPQQDVAYVVPGSP